jgi:hypothetical protein
VSGLTGGLVSLAVTLPLLTRGFVLAYDMVFVPRLPLGLQVLGVSRVPPRSVPAGAFVALLSQLVGGQVVEKAILVAIFAAGAYGAARLVPTDRALPRVGAGLFYAWNPFLFERLLLGHWALLLGYAFMPWLAGAALTFRRGEPGAGARLVLALALVAVPGPYTGLIGAGMAAVIVLWPGRSGSPSGPPRRAGLVGLAAVAVNLPWLVPALLQHAPPSSPGLATSLFRARSDSPLGTAGSLLSLGGFWRTDLAPPGRTTVAWLPAFAIILVLCTIGWRRLGPRWQRGGRAGLTAAAALGFVLAVAPAVPGLRDVWSWVARVVPGTGILRDSQKFVMPVALLGSVTFGLGVEAVVAAVGRAGDRVTAVAPCLLVLVPVALAPTLAWGLGGRLSPVSYPASWERARAIVDADPVPGALVVLPWHAYLPFGWNRDRTVHEPALQSFSRPVVTNSGLELGTGTLPDEDPWSLLARPAVLGPGPLGPALDGLGVRYVLLLREADWRAFSPKVAGLDAVLDSGDLALYRAPPPSRIPRFDRPPEALVLAGDAVALLIVALAASLSISRRRAGRPVPPAEALADGAPA